MTTGPENSAIRSVPGELPAILLDVRLAKLWRLVHRRMEQTGQEWREASVQLRDVTDEERMAIDLLLGTRHSGRTVKVSLGRLGDDLLRRTGRQLRDIVDLQVGSVEDRPSARRREIEFSIRLRDDLSAHPAVRRTQALDSWLDRLWASGRWRRLEDPRRCLENALSVLAVLPSDRPLPRSALAASVLGDAHALDDDAPLGRLVLSALGDLSGGSMPSGAAERRTLWRAFGVMSDDTSSTVLTAGLVPLRHGVLTAAAGEWGSTGVPFPIPLVALVAEHWSVSAGTVIWVCENPTVLSAGARSGRSIVCVQGRPSLAAIELLVALRASGAILRYHGDFGAQGIAIANSIVTGLGASPWRMSEADHAEGLRRARGGGVSPRALRGSVPDAVWDAGLSPAIRRCGVEIEEELVLDLLLEDLGRG